VLLPKIKAWIIKNPWLQYYFFIQLVLILWGGILNLVFDVSIPETQGAQQYYAITEVVPGYEDNQVLRFVTAPWLRWDAEWYLRIALESYENIDGRIAFAPLYPLLIFFMGKVLGGQYLLAGMIIAQFSLFVACALLYSIVKERFGSQLGEYTIQYLLFFPTAFFLFASYSESLFLVFLLLTWRAASKGEWPYAGLWGSLGVLVRFMGIGILLPLIYLWLMNKGERTIRNLIYIGTIPVTLIGWMVFAYFRYNTLLLGRLSGWGGLRSAWPWEGIWNNLRLVFTPGHGSFTYLHLDLISIVLFILLIISAYRKQWVGYELVMISLLVIPIFQVGDTEGILVSLSRFVLMAFPGFIILGEWGQHSKVFHRIWTILSLALLLFYSGTFFIWGWVA
jgi:hypothetical protein